MVALRDAGHADQDRLTGGEDARLRHLGLELRQEVLHDHDPVLQRSGVPAAHWAREEEALLVRADVEEVGAGGPERLRGE